MKNKSHKILEINENTDIHHIFPKAYCEDKNIPKQKWNSIINKTPLFKRTNQILGGSAPSEYLERIENEKHVAREQLDAFVKSHLVNVDLLRKDDFDAYFIERTKALLKEISKAMGKPISNLSGEDVIKEFGCTLE